MIQPISISFCVSKNTEVEIPEGKEISDDIAKLYFIKSDHFKHLKQILKSVNLFIDDFNVVLNE